LSTLHSPPPAAAGRSARHIAFGKLWRPPAILAPVRRRARQSDRTPPR